MAEPTLKDVLNATAKLEAKVEKRFDLVDKRFDDLDEELTLHAKVHKKVEEDIASLKGRPPRTAARAVRRGRAR